MAAHRPPLAALAWIAACLPASRADTQASASATVTATVTAGTTATVTAGTTASAPTATAVASAIPPPAPPPPAEAPRDCPAEMARIGRYCVDRYEAHLVTQKSDGSFTVHPHYQRPEDGVHYLARSAAGVFPQGYVSRNESERACKAAGKRLCTFNEWRRACQGKHWWRYPYGGREKPGVCSSGKDHLLSQLFGADSRKWEYDKHFNSPLLNQKEDFLAKAGAHSGCANDEKIYDMVGNLHEWVNGMVTQKFVDSLEKDKVERKEQHWRTGNGIFLGGFYSTNSQLGPGCYYVTYAHEPSYHDYSTGFRCCMDAPTPPPPPKKPAPLPQKKAPPKTKR